jgi:dipeptidyl aminopeptidase/acylaminoacyl peptidase
MSARRPAAGARRPRSGDPYGIRPSAALIAPIVAIVGLIIVGWLSLGLMTGNLPWRVGGKGGDAGASIGPPKTPTPSNEVIVPSASPGDVLKGSIVYAKAGNLWIEDATGAHQITSPASQADPGVDQMPSFTPDGKYIIYVETRSKRVLWKLGLHAPTYYTATYPIIFRIGIDGKNRQQLATGLYKSGRYQWWYWMRQPVLSPNGHTLALFSDGPDPTQSNVVLQLYDTATHKLTRVKVPEYPPLGHQDADWAPDGKTLLYVKNGRDGARGAPQIYRYDLKAKTTRAITGPGYEAPRYSPDGRYILATRTSALGTDVVILDARNGNELTRITDDAHSWGATWSPQGDRLAFLHIDGGVTDLEQVVLTGTPGRWDVGPVLPLTLSAGLDGASHPDWYIPTDQLPPPSVAPSASPSVAPSAP